jgi:transposase
MRAQTLTLTADEQAARARARNRDPRPYFRERAAALLKVAAGQSPRAVALHGLPRRRRPETVRAWLAAYRERGLAGLAQRPRGHRGFSPCAG